MGIPIHPVLSNVISRSTNPRRKSDPKANARVDGLHRDIDMFLTLGVSNEKCHFN